MTGRRGILHALLLVPPAFGVLALLLVPMSSHPLAARADEAPKPFDARQTFLSDCAVCHAADLRGVAHRGPDITHSDGALLDYELSTGRMPLMKPDSVPQRHAARYGARDEDALIRYILSLTRAPDNRPRIDLARADVAHGGELFRLNCAACHTVTGEGGALLHRPAPPLHHSTPAQIAEAVREGPGAMPAFGTASFSDRDLVDLVGYTRYLARPKDRGGFPLGHVGPITEGLVGFGLGTGLLLVVARAIGTKS